MRTTKSNLLYKFDIRCPYCRRKLMVINSSQYNEPQVKLLKKSELGVYITETRCHICKLFVAVDMIN